MIESSGQLGTISSSRRYKEEIRDMDDASRRLFDLRPVTFRYAQEGPCLSGPSGVMRATRYNRPQVSETR